MIIYRRDSELITEDYDSAPVSGAFNVILFCLNHLAITFSGPIMLSINTSEFIQKQLILKEQ